MTIGEQHGSERLVWGLVLSSALLAGRQSGCTQARDVKSMFSREYVACSECARFFAPPVQNMPGFVATGTMPSIFGDCWGQMGQTREGSACDHIM